MYIKGRKHVLFAKSVCLPRPLLRHIQTSLTSWEGMAIPILALIQERALPFQVLGSTCSTPCPPPTDRQLSQVQDSPSLIPHVSIHVFIHSRAYRTVKSTGAKWVGTILFSMAIIKGSFLHSWSNSHIDPSSHITIFPLVFRIPKHWISHVSAWLPLL